MATRSGEPAAAPSEAASDGPGWPGGFGAEGLSPEVTGRLFRSRPTVVVLGDAILDVWLAGRCDRLCREAPAPVVHLRQQSFAPGGAANTAVNLVALGAEVHMVTLLGDDAAGGTLTEELDRRGVHIGSIVLAPGRATVRKQRIVADNQVLVRVDDGDDRRGADAAETRQLLAGLRAALAGADALVVCDYGTGVLGPDVRDALLAMREQLPLLVVDAHDPRRWRDLRPDVVTPNAGEAGELLGIPVPALGDARVELLDRHRDRLAATTGAGTVVVTLDRDGAVLLADGQPVHRTWAQPAPDHHTAGAGDTFVAALTVALVGGLPATAAAELAQSAADIVVHRPGTAVCTAAEVQQRIGRSHDATLDHSELARVVAEHRSSGRRIVFTNGCFDVLHRGHVAYLNEAKRLGDVLVVAVNADESVRRLKGPDRPVNCARDRVAVLAALSCVDHVTVFEQDTPVELLHALHPEVYAKGGDYTPEMLSETPVVRDYGGEVRVLGYVPDQSTSTVIERIRSTATAP